MLALDVGSLGSAIALLACRGLLRQPSGFFERCSGTDEERSER
jgi:hypothetical protein